MVSVPEGAGAAIASKGSGTIGSGLTIIPTIVATKIARRCHALGSTPDGGGTNQIITPTSKTPNRRSASPQPEIVAPCLCLAGSTDAGTVRSVLMSRLSWFGTRRRLGLRLRVHQFESAWTASGLVIASGRTN